MKILVATASNYGSTREIGDRIASVLREAGHSVDSVSVDAVESFDYDAVIIGTAIYIGRPLTIARQFSARLEREFGTKPVWVFGSGMKNVTRHPLNPPFINAASRPYLGSSYPIFKGKVDPTQLSMAERTMAMLTAASVQDERDFNLIEQWARKISEQVEPAEAPKLEPGVLEHHDGAK